VIVAMHAGGDAVKITIQENERQEELEIVIHCKKADKQVVFVNAKTRQRL
jgi:hypothetical protein